MAYLQNSFWGLKNMQDVQSAMDEVKHVGQPIPLVKQVSLDDRRRHHDNISQKKISSFIVIQCGPF